ncbi:F-box domain [Arabidopsis suecica]|uniref:F-box domain n=1 Tax=Arabidopsis suecica TaxID=45249 RepID=A0A8T2AFX0_ARASU|nr:F-box domain [Arabidopsis suecica]
MDRFDNLPNEVLCHILSFLTTKEAALTSVLSKRWLNLWKLVRNIDIDDSVFLYPEEGKREREGILQCFMDFVDKVLALQGDSLIERFSLKCKTGIDSDRVNGWICNVLRRGVSHLELFLDFSRYDSDSEDMYFLPEELFVSKTLVELKLRSEYGVDWWYASEGTFLPMLKTLDIDSEWIILCAKLEMFRPAFPVLQELYLANMTWSNSDEAASNASLKKLTIYASGFDDYLNPKSISFDTPSLVYLEYSDFVAADYPKVNLTNLVEARLNLMVTEDQVKLIRAPNDEDDGFLHLRNVWKLMSGIRNVQKLFITADTLEVLSLCCDMMPVFNKLKFLRIKSDKERGWQAMPVLLRNCPHLETLVLEDLLHYVTDKCGDTCDCIDREDKGCSLSSCPVKYMKITGFRGTIREMKMIKHFLESFPHLKEMKIYIEENDPTEFEVPGMLKLVSQILTHYDKFFSCDVQFLVYTELYKKWPAE